MIDPTYSAPSIARPIRKPVGITKGPGESTHEYTFVSRDDAQELKNGEYVYYELSDPDGTLTQPRRVLGRVMKRVPLKLYPDSFLAEPEIAPSQVAAMVGYDSRANELFELHVAIMGYYDALHKAAQHAPGLRQSAVGVGQFIIHIFAIFQFLR